MNHHIEIGEFRAPSEKKIRLKHWPTRGTRVYDSEEQYKDRLAEDVKTLSALQKLLYATNQYALLLIFQAMDTAGKDGAINHVLSGINPEGCEVHSFKHPSADELEHDFLWRTATKLPARGRIGVFNRSYYEEVLITRVHADVLQAERVPGKHVGDKKFWDGRYESINDLEKHLHRNGTRVVKFFLHLSKEEQRQRLLARIDTPDKNWKFSEADIAERKYWKEYMRAYEQCVNATSTHAAPWYIVPADDKDNARLIISHIVIETMKGLNMQYPKSTPAHQRTLANIRRLLAR